MKYTKTQVGYAFCIDPIDVSNFVDRIISFYMGNKHRTLCLLLVYMTSGLEHTSE